MGEIVYNFSNLFKRKPKRFGWSWIFEIKYTGSSNNYEKFIEEYGTVY